MIFHNPKKAEIDDRCGSLSGFRARSRTAYVLVVLAGISAGYLLATPVSTADPPPPVSTKPVFRVGDWWEFDKRYMRQRCRKWEVVDADPGGFLVQQCDDHKLYRDYANHLEVVRVAKGSEDVITFGPALKELVFPLSVGQSWEQDYSGFSADNSNAWTSHTAWSVEAYESVTVAAGTFDAYRIEIFEEWVVEAYSGTLEATAWWSPAVKMFVKHEHGDPGDPYWSYELTAFELVPEPE